MTSTPEKTERAFGQRLPFYIMQLRGNIAIVFGDTFYYRRHSDARIVRLRLFSFRPLRSATYKGYAHIAAHIEHCR